MSFGLSPASGYDDLRVLVLIMVVLVVVASLSSGSSPTFDYEFHCILYMWSLVIT